MAKKTQAKPIQVASPGAAASKLPTAEEQVAALEGRLALGVGLFTISVARATGRIYTSAGGDWGEGSAGLDLMRQALEFVLAQVRQATTDAQVQERVIEQLRKDKKEANPQIHNGRR